MNLFGLFGKKTRVSEDKTANKKTGTVVIGEDGDHKLKFVQKGTTLHGLIAPSFIDRTPSDHIRIGNVFSRSLFVTGTPREIDVGTILGPLLNHDGDIDACIHIEPYDERESLDELIKMITRIEAELRAVIKSGDSSNDQELETAYKDAKLMRDRISKNQSRLFCVSVGANLFEDSLEALNEKAVNLEGQMALGSLHTRSASGRCDEGFLSATALGVNLITDTSRNLDSYAVSTLFPFISADFFHRNGFPFAINYYTGAPITFDPYDPSLDNYNSFICAGSGKGKSTTAKTFANRALFVGEISLFIDVMGEFTKLTLKRGGVSIQIGGGEYFLNPCDLTASYDPDREEYIVKVDQKISDMTAFIDVLCNGLKPEEASFVEDIWVHIYRTKFGFSEDPESLYEDKHDEVEEDSGVTIRSGKFLKKMPRISDFCEEGNNRLKDYPEFKNIFLIVSRYQEGKPLGFFDHYTNFDLENRPMVNFNIKDLSEDARRIAMHGILNWAKHQFIQKDKDQRGRIWFEEAWRLARGKSAQMTLAFLEDFYRTARHHMKGITAISQDFRPFAAREEGQAIFQNSDTLIFLNNKKAELDAIREQFGLSEAELSFLSSAGVSEGILRVKQKSIAFKLVNTPSEQEVVYSTKRRMPVEDDA